MKKPHPIAKVNQPGTPIPASGTFPVFSTWDGRLIDRRDGRSRTDRGTCPDRFRDLPFRGLMAWNGIVLREEDTDIPSLTYAYLREARKISCGECSVCMIGIDRVMEIFRRFMDGKGTRQDLKEIAEIAHEVTVNGKCNFGRSAALVPVADAVKWFRSSNSRSCFTVLAKTPRSWCNWRSKRFTRPSRRFPSCMSTRPGSSRR